MEAFEKWFEEVYRVDDVSYIDAKAAWKAALRWVLEDIESFQCLYDRWLVMKRIEKELGEE